MCVKVMWMTHFSIQLIYLIDCSIEPTLWGPRFDHRRPPQLSVLLTSRYLKVRRLKEKVKGYFISFYFFICHQVTMEVIWVISFWSTLCPFHHQTCELCVVQSFVVACLQSSVLSVPTTTPCLQKKLLLAVIFDGISYIKKRQSFLSLVY